MADSLFGSGTFSWDDQDKRGNIMYRLPRNIKLNDNIVVREDEIAVFYRDGKVLAYFDRPDRYALTSQNAPIVGKLVKALSGVQQLAEVIYLQKRAFDGKFGSKQPYQFRDKEFGMVNLRVFGEFRYKVGAPENFVNQFVGTFNYATSAEVEERIKEQMVVLIYNTIGEMKNEGMGVLDLGASLTNIEQSVLSKSNDHFDLYGVSIDKISGLYISMPDEVQKAVDTRASMQALGTNYIQYQSGQAMSEAAQNPSGGAAGVGVGVGAGVGLGYTMVDQMRQPARWHPRQDRRPNPWSYAPSAALRTWQGPSSAPVAGLRWWWKWSSAPNAAARCPADAKFCPECGNAMQAKKKCPKCGTEAAASAKFCPECGTTF